MIATVRFVFPGYKENGDVDEKERSKGLTPLHTDCRHCDFGESYVLS
jgi:hypothetical protein